MVLNILNASVNFVGYQVPLFLLVFGVIYLVLAFALKGSFGPMAAVPLALSAVALGAAWLYVSGARVPTIGFGRLIWMNLPLFILAAGIIYLGLAFAIQPVGQLGAVPMAATLVVLAVAWMTMGAGSIFAIPLGALNVIGVGIALVVVGKAFASG